jgi:hypothetical protein
MDGNVQLKILDGAFIEERTCFVLDESAFLNFLGQANTACQLRSMRAIRETYFAPPRHLLSPLMSNFCKSTCKSVTMFSHLTYLGKQVSTVMQWNVFGQWVLIFSASVKNK